MSIAVTSCDAMGSRLGLRGIVNHICELGLRNLFGMNTINREGLSRVIYLKCGDIHGLLRYMTGRER